MFNNKMQNYNKTTELMNNGILNNYCNPCTPAWWPRNFSFDKLFEI